MPRHATPVGTPLDIDSGVSGLSQPLCASIAIPVSWTAHETVRTPEVFVTPPGSVTVDRGGMAQRVLRLWWLPQCAQRHVCKAAAPAAPPDTVNAPPPSLDFDVS